MDQADEVAIGWQDRRPNAAPELNPRSNEPLVSLAHAEVNLDEVRRGACSPGGQRRRRGGVGAIRPLAELAALRIPSKTSAVPMTFLHQGKQYIVFATGADANTSLVALTLPGSGQ